LKELIYFGEKPYTSTDYDGLVNSFIGSYEQLQKKILKVPLLGKPRVEA
jgi:hypothetical protein